MSGRNKGHGEEHGGDERWLVSYADFITLLFVLFVVLYSLGQVDVEKYKILAESMRAAFSAGGAVKVVSNSISSGGGSDPTSSEPDPITIPGMPKKPPQSEQVASELTKMLGDMNLSDGVSVQTSIEGVLISLSESLIYYPGTATLYPQAYPVLDGIIQMLNSMDNDLRIVGHTDDSPSTDPRYTNNFELSVGRAMVVAQYLIQSGINPARITVSGKGEYAPIFANDTPEHRAMNSRAEIIIIYKDSTSKVTTGSGLP
jgi:chemotaxis protein MotB